MANPVFRNTLYTSDNLYVLLGLDSGLVDLIYLDPPFNSKRTYSAPVGSKAAGASFKDMWTWKDVDEHNLDSLAVSHPDLTKFIAGAGEIHGKPMMAYLTYMSQRVVEMRRVLKDTGSFYLHCDPTAGHYLKIMLDGIFGKKNFIAEIIWSYAWGVRTTRRWNRKHDVILMYAKSRIFTFNYSAVMEKRREEVLRRLEFGSASATMAADRGKSGDRTMALPTDVWYIPTLNAMSKERTGYPTQKPLDLLKRIVLASSNEGDVVMDPFCGCATTCVAAQQLGRKWIGIDVEEQARNVLIRRLSSDAGGIFNDFTATRLMPRRTDLTEVPPSGGVKQRLFGEQQGKCNACGQAFEPRNLEIDHIVPKSKGGGDYYENYQLLCGSCNRIKGDRPMEYLRMKIATLERAGNRASFGE